MKYCSSCGGEINLNIPKGDNRERHVCAECGDIHYQNPNIVVGCVAQWEGKIMLCKRAIEPRYGYWTLPAGFLENHESTECGAAREVKEEACAEVLVGDLLTIYSLPHISQIHLMYLAEMVNGEFAAGEESLEVKMVAEEEVPWGQLAFRTVELSLKAYFEGCRTGNFKLRQGVIDPLSKQR